MEKSAKRVAGENLILFLTGALAGAVNGFFGGGGGMLVVPSLVMLLKRKPNRAHATALLVILPVTVLSGLIYALFGNFQPAPGIPACIGVVAGGAAGAALLKNVNGKALGRIFAFVILAAGIKSLFF